MWRSHDGGGGNAFDSGPAGAQDATLCGQDGVMTPTPSVVTMRRAPDKWRGFRLPAAPDGKRGFRLQAEALLAMMLALLATGSPASAQGLDLTLFLGRAYPIYDERLVLRPNVPSTAGVDVTVVGAPEIRTKGGPVFGAAVAVELGILGIEGRLDATDVAFDFTGARLDLRPTLPPLQELRGSVTVGDGRFDAERLPLLSLNARLRTPGPVGLVASGGLSYLRNVDVTGSVPVAAVIGGVPFVPQVEPRLRLRAAPGTPEHRFGINGGAGLRIGGPRVALMGEVRAFYFRAFELRFAVDGVPDLVRQVLDSVDPVRFEPVIVNAQVGLVFRF